MKSNNRHNLCILIIIIGIFLFVPNAIFAQEWQFVKSGKEFGISGMALIEQNDDHLSFLVNHDSKKENDIRLAIVTIDTNNKIQYIPLNWPEGIDLPEDLEALTAIPHGNGTSFMTLVSNGRIYHIKLNISEGSITVLKVFTLPGVSGRSNFEGFALKEIGDKLLAVWADRGKNSCPAIIYWGLFNLRTYEFSDLNSTPLKVPWPKKSEVRHVSDLKIDTHGNLFVSSTSDPGDDGSFQSAVYMVGLFCINSGNVLFRKNTTLKEIYHFEGHKVEALEILPGGLSNIVLATDDENMGASIFLDISRTYVQEEIRLLEEIVRLDEVIAERLRF
ncbi:MAG: hypothetical protein ABH952_06765, partial [Candidatus Omnitrophota bacterium]